MRRRIYWMLPNVASAKRTMDDMLLARIEVRHMHFVAREGTDLSTLHAASLLQTSDLVRAAESGLAVGGLTGGLAGAVVGKYFPIVGDAPQWGWIGLLAIVGALFGAWVSGMIGVSHMSKRLRRFEPRIQSGEILLMIDLRPSQIADVKARLQSLHPEAHLEGVEPNIPAFP